MSSKRSSCGRIKDANILQWKTGCHLFELSSPIYGHGIYLRTTKSCVVQHASSPIRIDISSDVGASYQFMISNAHFNNCVGVRSEARSSDEANDAAGVGTVFL